MSTKVYSGFAFGSLHAPDISIPATRKMLNFGTNNMKEWNMGFWKWTHDYRLFYSMNYLKKIDMNPEVTSTVIQYDYDALDAYILSVDPDVKERLNTDTIIPDIEYQFRFHMQQTYGGDWSNKNNIFTGTLGGTTTDWYLDFVSYIEDTMDIDAEGIDKRWIVGNFYQVGFHFNTQKIQIDNIYQNTICMNTTYSRNSADPDEWFTDIIPESLAPAGITHRNYLEMTPIIPLREQNTLLMEEKNIATMMKKIHVDSEDFMETLTKTNEDSKQDPTIQNAYLINALPLRNPYEVEPGVYVGSRTSVLPYAITRTLKNTGTNEDKEIYTVTQEDADKFYKKHLKEQTVLAKALFKTFAEYSGRLDTECSSKKRHTAFYMNDCVKDFEGHVGESGEDEAFGGHVTFPTISGGIHITKSYFDAQYAFSISVKTYTGKVRPEEESIRSQGSFHFSGTIFSDKIGEDQDVKEDDYGKRRESETPDSEGFDQLVIKVQKDENHYQEMIITNYSTGFQVDGINGEKERRIIYTLGYPPADNRLIIPFFVMYGATTREYITIYEHSATMFMYSARAVKTAWYKPFIGLIAAAVFCLTGYGCSVGMLILKMAISMVVSKIIGAIMSLIDSDWAKLLLQAAMIIGGVIYGVGGDLSAISSEVYLQTAFDLAQLGYGAYNIHNQKIIMEEQKQQRIEEAYNKRIESIENLDSQMALNVPMLLDAHTSFADRTDVESYYSNAYGENLYNYDQFYNIDGVIDLRKQVSSG